MYKCLGVSVGGSDIPDNKSGDLGVGRGRDPDDFPCLITRGDLERARNHLEEDELQHPDSVGRDRRIQSVGVPRSTGPVPSTGFAKAR